MGILLGAQGRLDDAEPYYHEALEGRRSTYGEDHPQTVLAISNMSAFQRKRGNGVDDDG